MSRLKSMATTGDNHQQKNCSVDCVVENCKNFKRDTDDVAGSNSTVRLTASISDPTIKVEIEPNASTETMSTTISSSMPIASYTAEKMRRKLQFFFMNPIEKWQARQRFPYKFVVQLVKIVFVTMQLCLFAHYRYNHINYTGDNKISFSHLFLRGWDTAFEIKSYPPPSGPLAVYLQDDLYETIDYAIVNYQNLSNAVGPYSYPNEDNTMSPLIFCIYQYKEGIIYGFNESYVFNAEIEKHCFDMSGNVTTIGSKEYLIDMNAAINFSSFVKATLDFAVKTVNFKVAGPIAPPDCYKFDIQILFDNSNHDGQILLSLDAEALRLKCKGDTQYVTDSEIDAALRSTLNVMVILICSLSFVLCTRAIYRAQLLRAQTVRFFKFTYQQELSWDGKVEFINFWYIMIIFNDILLIIGSALKEQIERKNVLADEWNVCSLLLGIGNLLVWFGVLRYLGFFKTYNVVILTLKRAAPKISRFLICALMIYAGFTFCGWLVLGPYHMKFRSLATTSECLFALINGDDMFATFTTMESKSVMLWWFSRIYLYSFISLYIYVVLSLFISVIMDAYDTIKKYYKDGFPANDLRAFMGSMDAEDFQSGVFRTDVDGDRSSFFDVFQGLCCGCCGSSPQINGPTGYTSLSNKGST